MSGIFSRRSIRYSLPVLVSSKRSSGFLLYKRSEEYVDAESKKTLSKTAGGQRRVIPLEPPIILLVDVTV